MRATSLMALLQFALSTVWLDTHSNKRFDLTSSLSLLHSPRYGLLIGSYVLISYTSSLPSIVQKSRGTMKPCVPFQSTDINPPIHTTYDSFPSGHWSSRILPAKMFSRLSLVLSRIISVNACFLKSLPASWISLSALTFPAAR